MRTSMRADLTAAIKTKDRVASTALRSALAAIDNAEAQPVDHLMDSATDNDYVAGAVSGLGGTEIQRRHLSEEHVRAIVESEIAERSAAAHGYERSGHDDRAEYLRAEATVLGKYLSAHG